MASITLNVKMLGKFTLSYEDVQITSDNSRSSKLWCTLAYLIYHRGRVISADELITLLRADEKENANPQSTLKTTVFRLRALLNTVYDGLGRDLIVSRDKGYTINPDFEIITDYEKFEKLLSKKDTDSHVEALELYSGNFLNSFSSEAWIIPISAYYYNTYAQALVQTVPLLEEKGLFELGVTLCKNAIAIDSYAEPFYQMLMQCLLALNKRNEVAVIYENMSKTLLSTFGVMPDAESRALYREALRTVNLHVLTPDTLYEQLDEIGPITSALLCDFDFFKMLYQANARMIARSGDAVHIALLTVVSCTKKELQRRSLDLAMDNLQALLCSSLRKGDAISRCASSQFVIMLPQANYENSIAVCNRIIDAFSRKYPHSPARIDYFVKAIVPAKDS